MISAPPCKYHWAVLGHPGQTKGESLGGFRSEHHIASQQGQQVAGELRSFAIRRRQSQRHSRGRPTARPTWQNRAVWLFVPESHLSPCVLVDWAVSVLGIDCACWPIVLVPNSTRSELFTFPNAGFRILICLLVVDALVGPRLRLYVSPTGVPLVRCQSPCPNLEGLRRPCSSHQFRDPKDYIRVYPKTQKVLSTRICCERLLGQPLSKRPRHNAIPLDAVVPGASGARAPPNQTKGSVKILAAEGFPHITAQLPLCARQSRFRYISATLPSENGPLSSFVMRVIGATVI
jgi:hypothetical protein